MRRGYVYILASKPYGTLYIGVTSNLSARLEQHRHGTASSFTKKYGVARLVYYEAHDWITSAIQRETNLKRWKRDWKIELIEHANPTWDDLERTLC
ncbi:MAG: GIY-YIG nuclease family protein [Alphaproteobacteria bacterium]|jgi:putative endonuclease